MARRRGKFGKAALLVGAAAMAAGILLKREKVAALLPSRSQSGGQDTGWAPAQAPVPSNYDAPGPVANTATPVPAPEPQVLTDEGAIDEQAEEAAAAAEAANIGGPVSDYAGIGEPSLGADEADRPLVEAGEGSSEGQEQAEAALADAAQPTAPGTSDYERQIDEAIEQAEQPASGERLEPVAGVHDAPGDAEGRAAEAATTDMAAEGTPAPAEPETAPPAPAAGTTPAAPQSGQEEPGGPVPFGAGTTADPLAEPPPVTPAVPQTTTWQPPAPEESSDPTPPAQEQQPLPEKDDKEGKDDSDEWRTWSGRSIDP